MGTYGDHYKCPKCGFDASVQFRNDLISDLYLVCSKCGLHIYCERRRWVVTKTFVDTSVIGLNIDDLDIDVLFKENNEKTQNKRQDYLAVGKTILGWGDI
jgi:predicted RNA-binding Zn-ribbon protein involved in translation (DUF1610 family)